MSASSSPAPFYFSNHFTFSFDAQNLLFVTVAMLSLYQSRRKVEGNFMYKVDYRYWFQFPGLQFIYSYLKMVKRLFFSRTR